MKIAFVQNFWYEYLGVASISAVVKQHGHQTRVFINGWEKNLLQAVLEFNPDVIAFPVYSGSQGWVFETAAQIKKILGKFTIAGGPHATFFPEIIYEKGIDIVCRGEGEYPMLELLDKLETGEDISRISNLWIKKGKIIIKNPIRPLINPLNKLPPYDRDIYYRYPILANNSVKNFNIGRGCPYNCAYCHNSGLVRIYQDLGLYVRNYAQSRVIKEIKQVIKKFPLKTICFIDDTFIWDKRWLSKFLIIYKKEIGLPFVCNIRGNLLDEVLVKNLAKAGCMSVFMGIESGNEEMRIKLLQKTVTDEHLAKAAKLLHKYHIILAANNMIGLPGETIHDAFKTIQFNAKIHVDLPWCSIFQPYPGTQMADYCLKMGFIKKADLANIGVSFHKQSILKIKDIDQLVRLHKLFHLGVWFPYTLPLIKILIKLPLNPVYDLIFLINQGLTYIRFFRLSLLDFLPHAVYFAKFYLSRTKVKL